MIPNIPLANKVEFTDLGENSGQFIIEPLYPGYGLTIGNALRRVLLSSLPGAAVTAIKIKGVDHEFSNLPYIKEDVVEIILNLKQLRIKVEQDFEDTLTIIYSGNGEHVFKAGDFKCPSQLSIANPELHIATLTDQAAKFDIECTIEQGRGFVPVENRDREKLEIGNIAIDSYFSPIAKVNFKKENVRVGQMTNWDKLILDIHTDGTMDCQEALKYSANILNKQFGFLVDPQNTPQDESTESLVTQPNNSDDKFDQPLSEEDPQVNKTEIPTSEETPKVAKKRGRPKKVETN